ncbi:S8 family peptidase [Parathalassolituus penaei]|uniref:S8 family peptidase n=1 Tax=Parathalassolituus penaei TaxID=2997323 RepID=A0A9X3EEG6_9GAMM|nr:S8 family peptidase [Parathalassolituus penaei]MCY0965700.1 S8 family peptidase [Parathalassolituus penaei]
MMLPYPRKTLPVLLASLLLTACSGGGSSSSSSNNDSGDNAGGDDSGNNSGTTTLVLSGTLSAEAATAVDSDTNDVYATYASNNTMANAQDVQNLVTIHGFASKTASGGQLSGASSMERFANSADQVDYYRASLQAGQTIRLEVSDYDTNGNRNLYPGDLDLYLLSDTGEAIESSQGAGLYEEITVPESGTWYVVVYAYSGVSRYVLQLGAADSTSSIASKLSADFVPNQMLVRTRDQSLSSQASISSADGQSIAIRAVTGNSQKHPAKVEFASPISTAQTASANGKASERQAMLADIASHNPTAAEKIATLMTIKDMAARNDVEFAEPNYIRQPLKTPNDPYYSRQWHYTNINLPAAWDISTGTRSDGEDVVVAVVDTGVYLAHPDLSGQLLSGYDFVSSQSMSNDGNGIDSNPDDPGDSTQRGYSSWHGTHVAGTIGATSNNNVGVAGVSWGVKILPVRVLGVGGGTSYDIIQGLYYSAGLENDSGTVPSQKADIINMSLGSYGYSASEQLVMNELYDAGVIVVAAAGNDGISSPSYPASYNHVISVSATDYADNLTDYSNYGSNIDLAAPGGDTSADLNHDGNGDGVLSTLVSDASGSRQPIYYYYNGTSMAAPHVAGVLALMKAIYPALTPSEVESLISSGSISDDLGSSGKDIQYGYGRINALKAVTIASQLASGAEVELPVVLQSSPARISLGSSSTTSSLTISNTGGGDPLISGVVSSASWLTVAATDVNANGLGTYTLTADRTDLVAGSYSATITFSTESDTSLEVGVTMLVGSASDSRELTTQYVLAYDYASGEYVDGAIAEEDGSYSLELSPGTYVLYAGSDVDVDNIICDSGETCGSYPSLAQPSGIVLTTADKTGVDFTVAIQSVSETAATSLNMKPLSKAALAALKAKSGTKALAE